MITIKRVFNHQGVETGAILTGIFPTAITVELKARIESQLITYAFNVLYPGVPLSVFKEYNNDLACVTVIKGINNLPDTRVEI